MKTLYTSAVFVLAICFIALFYSPAAAQNARLRDDNTIGWYTFTGTFRWHQKWSLHTEYQWRRENFLPDWQQSLLRLGVNYHVHSNVTLHAGYGWIVTFDYGDVPINPLGRTFPEHRTYQQVNLTQKVGRMDVLHRYRLEQRWIGQFTSVASEQVDRWTYLNRLRYMARIQVPLKGSTLDDREFYAAAFDEIFIGFGRNINQNVFDQNRLALLGGYRFNSKLRVEAGFLQQIVQLPRRVQDRNLFQYNNGLLVNMIISTDLVKGL
jgi:hypothetical protein